MLECRNVTPAVLRLPAPLKKPREKDERWAIISTY